MSYIEILLSLICYKIVIYPINKTLIEFIENRVQIIIGRKTKINNLQYLDGRHDDIFKKEYAFIIWNHHKAVIHWKFYI